jgi:hypothetical protein
VSAPKDIICAGHYETLHKDKFGVLVGKPGEGKLKKLECYLQKHRNIFTLATATKQAEFQASFVTSHIIAKKSNTFIYDQCVKESLKKAD